ncbi:MAG: ABC transporter permease subunit [Eubacteriales bacterium]|nr:ABC transporter permease subunit [Eubacteriales bacterium]
MMRLNPIIKKEIEIKSRSLTLPVIMTVFNAVLFVIGLSAASSLILLMKRNYTADYGSFLRAYLFVVMLEFVMVIFSAPLFTAASISGEREKGTLDLLLTTALTPADIVIEKFISAYLSMCMLIVSCLPAMLIPLMFGGVHIQSTVFLMLIMAVEVIFVLAIGMFSSCIGGASVRSIAIAYALTAGVTAGPFIISAVAGAFTATGHNAAAYIFVIDPLLPVFAILADQIGESGQLASLFSMLNAAPDMAFLRYAAFIGVTVQLAAGAALIMGAILYLTPRRKQGLEKEARSR